MHLSKNRNNGEPKAFQPDIFFSPNNARTFDAHETHYLIGDEIDGGTCSTPYIGAPSSPGSGPTSDYDYFFSAPSSPMHFVLSSSPSPSPEPTTTTTTTTFNSTESSSTLSGSFEFDFSSNCSPNDSIPNESMLSADDLFLNGQIRPMKLSSHLQLQTLAPSFDLEVGDEDKESNGNIIIIKDSYSENREDSVTKGRDLSSRNGSLHRKTRSMSPLRTEHFFWQEENAFELLEHEAVLSDESNKKGGTIPSSIETTPSRSSSSSSRSSSSGRNSKKWMFLKDLLHRSKSEGGAGNNNKVDKFFWPYMITFSPVKSEKEASSASSSVSLSSSSSRDEKDKNGIHTDKHKGNQQVPMKKSVAAGKPANSVAKRASAHELHYTANRAQAEEMKKKTYLPYRQGLLGCLGFSSKGYGALNGFTKTLNPVSPRESRDHLC